MDSPIIIQITVDELREKIRINDNITNILDYSTIFKDDHLPYRDTFFKSNHIKIYSIKFIKTSSSELSRSFPRFSDSPFSEKNDKKIHVKNSELEYDNSNCKIRDVIDAALIKITKSLIPTDFALYLDLNENLISHETIDTLNKNYIKNHPEIYKSAISKNEEIFECLIESWDEVYNIFWKNIKQGKGFVLRKTSFHFLRSFYDYKKDENCARDFLNNSYMIFESQLDDKGILIFTNKINHLELFQEMIKLKDINKNLASSALIE